VPKARAAGQASRVGATRARARGAEPGWPCAVTFGRCVHGQQFDRPAMIEEFTKQNPAIAVDGRIRSPG